MNNMIIFLRTKNNQNLFRDVIVDSIDSNIADTAYLCSGFFQEFYRTSSYQASREKNFNFVCRKTKIKLITIGIHNRIWLQSYKNFKQNLIRSNVNIIAYVLKGFKWHAKICILEKNKRNILGVIGSSNITRPAFGLSTPFNYECDVIVWDSSIRKLNKLFDTHYKKHEPKEIIRTEYLSKNNQDISIHERLEHIKKLFMDKEKLRKLTDIDDKRKDLE